jgi:hypothetical protein
MQRTGYVVLAVSGLVVATAFAAIAALAGSGTGNGASGPGVQGGGQSTPNSVEVVQGYGVPGGPITVPGAGVPAQTSSATPTTVVRVGADGHRTTSVLPPPFPGEPPASIPAGSVVVTGPPSGWPGSSVPDPPSPTDSTPSTASEDPTTSSPTPTDTATDISTPTSPGP